MPYIGKSPHFGVRNRFIYTASADATSISGADANGATLTFTDGAYVDVYLNGILLKAGTDYVTTTANTIGSLAALSTSDEVVVLVYDVFSVSDTVSAASGGTFSGGVTVGSTLDVTGNVSLDGGAVTINESSADVDFRVESNGQTHMLFVDGGNDAVILGHSAKVDGINDDNEGVKGSGGQLQLHGATPVIDIFSYSTTDATHGGINFMKSASDTVGTNTIIGTGDIIGSIAFGGYDGVDYASIMGKIDFQAGGSGMAENDTAGEMVFYTTADGSGGGGSSERMRISSDGTVRITSHLLQIGNNASSDAQIQFDANASNWIMGIDQSDSGYFKFSNSTALGTSDSMVFGGGGLVTVGGNFVVGGSSVVNSSELSVTAGTDARVVSLVCGGTSANDQISFQNGNGEVGTIRTSGSSTSFNTSSDYRLKENINYSWDATTRLKQLKPARFNFKADADLTVDGFIADEVSSIVPEAISGKKDATKDLGIIKDKDGNVTQENALEIYTKKDEGQTWTKTGTENVYQQIDQSKLVPLLVKTIQELEARVKALEDA